MLHNNNNNNNNGLLTMYPRSGFSPVRNYIIRNEKLQYTISNNSLLLKDVVWNNSNATQYTIYKLFTNVISFIYWALPD